MIRRLHTRSIIRLRLPVNRKFFSAIFLVLWLALLSPIASYSKPSVKSQNDKALGLFDSFIPQGDIRRFAGETLYFDISFLWFDNAATSKVSFLEKNGRYYCILEAKTRGFVGWFTANRKHVYKAYFDIIDNGKRVRAYKFEWVIIAGDDVERAEHRMNYTTRKHSWVTTRNGKIIEKKTDNIPKGVNYDDILSVFYNLRNSVYGKLKKGSSYTIHTIPEKGHKTLSVQIKSGREEERVRIEAGRKNLTELLMNVSIPKEIFKTKTGELMFWASKNYIPLETTVKDYIFLGNLNAKFSKRVYRPQRPLKKMSSNTQKISIFKRTPQIKRRKMAEVVPSRY